MAKNRLGMPVLVVFACLSAAGLVGCNGDDENADVCPSGELLEMADASEATDYHIDFDLENSSGIFDDGQTDSLGSYRPSAGGMSFQTDDLECIASPDHPCEIEITQFHLSFGAVELATSRGAIRVESLELSTDVPFTSIDVGNGHVLPASTPVRLNLSLAGHDESQTLQLGTAANIMMDGTWQSMQANMWMPFELHVTQDGTCAVAETELVFNGSGEYPWELP